MAELVATNINEDGVVYDVLYIDGKSRIFVSYADNTEEEQEEVLDGIKNEIANILMDLAEQGIYI